MFGVIWRLAAIGLLVPFCIFPIVNIVAIPVELYLVFSLFAIARRRHSAPPAIDHL